MEPQDMQNKIITTTIQEINKSKIEQIKESHKCINQEIIKTISALITIVQEDAFKALTVEDVFTMRPLLTDMKNNARKFSDDLGEALYVFDHVDPESAKRFIKIRTESKDETEK